MGNNRDSFVYDHGILNFFQLEYTCRVLGILVWFVLTVDSLGSLVTYSIFGMDECRNFSIKYSRGELWALKPPFQKYAEHVFVPNHVKHQIVDYGIRRLLRPYRRCRAGLKLLQ